MDLYDAMVSHELGELNSSPKGAKVQFNVNNLANTKYVAPCASDSACFYGMADGDGDSKLRLVRKNVRSSPGGRFHHARLRFSLR